MVSGSVDFIGVFEQIVRPSRSLTARFVRKVSKIFQVVAASKAPSRRLCPDDQVDVAVEHLQQGQQLIDGLAVIRLVPQAIQLRR
jgi:hypothetical protein